ncbi:MAG: tetratricopeptide repeat protein [Azospirillaceae bacterium]|nr:tetratricopeptide repeat protein [Azospirillaceae bacterium]
MTTDPEYQIARDHWMAGRVDAALTVCQRVVDRDPGRADAIQLLAMLCARVGRLDEASAQMVRALTLKPDEAAWVQDLGLLTLQAGRSGDAVTLFRRALVLDPARAISWHRLGSLAGAGAAADGPAVLTALARAVRLRPAMTPAVIDYAQALNQAARFEEAVGIMQNAMARQPQSPALLNLLAATWRDLGRLDAAASVYRDAVHDFPQLVVLHHNLGVVLQEAGQTGPAIAAYRAGAALDAANAAIRFSLGNVLAQSGDLAGAVTALREAVAIDPDFADAHMALYVALQLLHQRPAAIGHLRQAVRIKDLFTEPCRGKQPRRSILVLEAVGDWQANVPHGFLLDPQVSTIHRLFLTEGQSFRDLVSLPPHDVVFNAIAEPDRTAGTLALAARLLEGYPKPVINDPRKVARTGRDAVAQALADPALAGHDQILVPRMLRLRRDQLIGPDAAGFLAAHGVTGTILARPVGTHAGDDLARLDNIAALHDYVAALDADHFFVCPFVDYRDPDGFYRKYRLIFVEGQAYPFHMAVSPRWMVHYYNAPMLENAWMRAEEEAFLADHRTRFGALQPALDAIARTVDLDYFGLDCGVTADGRLLLFEVDVGIIVHLLDSKEHFPYKHRYVPRIFDAVEAMLDRRCRGT